MVTWLMSIDSSTVVTDFKVMSIQYDGLNYSGLYNY